MLLTTNRGLFKYIIFSIFTLGIYSMYFIHAVAKELNISCAGDMKHTRGLFAFIFFSIITLGIYGLAWWLMTASRMNECARRHGMVPRIGGGSFFLWNTIGCLLFGLGPLIAMYKYIHQLNDVNYCYNRG